MKHDIKSDVAGALSKIETLRDEIRLHLHLATLDAKKEWTEALEPKVAELQDGAKHLGGDVRDAATEILEKLEGFAARLRDAAMSKKSN